MFKIFNKSFFLLLFFLCLSGIVIFWTTNIYIKIGPYDLLTYISDKSFNQRLERVLELDKERLLQKEITLILWENVYIKDKVKNIPTISIRRKTDFENVESFARSLTNIVKAIFNEQSLFVEDIEYELYLNNEKLLQYWIQKIEPENYPIGFLEQAYIDKEEGIVAIIGNKNITTWEKQTLFSTKIKLKESYSKINLLSSKRNPKYQLSNILLVENQLEKLYKKYNEKIMNPIGGIQFQINDTKLFLPYTLDLYSKYVKIQNTDNFFSYEPTFSRHIYQKYIEKYPSLQREHKYLGTLDIIEPTIINNKFIAEVKTLKPLTLEGINESISFIKNENIFNTLILNIEPKEVKELISYDKGYLVNVNDCEPYDLKKEILPEKEVFDFFVQKNIPFKNKVINWKLIGDKKLENFTPTSKLTLLDDINLYCYDNNLYILFKNKYYPKEYFWDTNDNRIIYNYSGIRQEYIYK